ncbi:MAG TPA: 3'-5' exonuclease [Vicinamibacterales bacterium]|jgi:superfamily I DNA/RNA helicase
MSWLVAPEELTPDQSRAIALEPSEHRAIIGGPGSGKTQILLYRAQFLARKYHVPPNRFHIFVYTNVLKSYIRTALNYLDLPLDCVSTLDGWCKTYFQTHIGGRVPWDAQAKRPDFDAIRNAILQRTYSNLLHEPAFDFVLVDEGQDLDRPAFELLSRLSKHVTVCADRKQQIYDRGSEEREILTALGLRSGSVAFLDAYRCCPYITQLAASLLDDPVERTRYLRQVRTTQTEREKPLLYLAQDFEDEKKRLVEIVRSRQVKGERIAILFGAQRQIHGFAKGLREQGLEVEIQEEADFSSDLPKLITYHSAKGLTFDTVLLPRLVGRSFPYLTDRRLASLLFVGVTRAVKWVYMSTTEDGQQLRSVLERVIPLADGGGPLVVQRGRAAAGIQKSLFGSGTPDSRAGDTDDILDPL